MKATPFRKSTAGITVRLPDIETVPEKYRGKPYSIFKLLGDGDSNPKLLKSDAGSTRYLTFGLTLAPADESGYQTCPRATAGCRKACLYNQGRGRGHTARAARIAKTVAFHEERDWFARRLRRELGLAAEKAAARGRRAALRPNVLSDVAWEKVFPWMFAGFPEIQFYDYTKVAPRVLAARPANYHLTFSRSESNHEDCLRVLAAGGNVSVVFRRGEFPTSWSGYPVVDGDKTDLRFLEPPGSVVALKAKGTSWRDTSGFVLSLPVLQTG